MNRMCTDLVESVIRDCFLSYAALPDASIDDEEGVLSVRTSVPLPFFNGVPGAALRAGDAHERVRATVARFREKGIPFRWWVTPSSEPADLIEVLKANGFRHTYDAPGMVVDLVGLREQQPIDGFRITRVQNAEEMLVWARVIGQGFKRPEPEWPVWQSAFNAFGYAPDARWRHFVGWLNGDPVATTTMCIGPEIAGVYHVVTLPHARNRGIGAAVTLAGLEEARNAGCRVAGLQSAEMAYGVYRSLGFRHCCDLTLYDWRPEYE